MLIVTCMLFPKSITMQALSDYMTNKVKNKVAPQSNKSHNPMCTLAVTAESGIGKAITTRNKSQNLIFTQYYRVSHLVTVGLGVGLT